MDEYKVPLKSLTKSNELMENSLLDTISLPVQFIPLVYEYINGESIDSLATKYNMEVTRISEFLNRREVKTFINTKLKNYKYLSLQKRIDLLSRAVDEKVAFAEENELPITNKDLVEVLKLLREEAKDLRSELSDDTGDEAKNNYIAIINQLKA